MLMMASEFDAVTSPAFIAQARQAYRGDTQRAVQFPNSPHGALFHSPTTSGTNCAYEVVIQFFNMEFTWNAQNIDFSCVQSLLDIDYSASSSETIALSNQVFGNPDPWGNGTLPAPIFSGSNGLPFRFDFDSTAEFDYTSDELPDIPKFPLKPIVVFDTYDTSNIRDTTNTISGVVTVFYPYREYAGWVSPDGDFRVVGSGYLLSPSTLTLVFIFCIYLVSCLW
jgi:hypothetical protein